MHIGEGCPLVPWAYRLLWAVNGLEEVAPLSLRGSRKLEHCDLAHLAMLVEGEGCTDRLMIVTVLLQVL